ncbi:MAG: sulfotransferase [Rhodobacterales bacterium]|nr:sulfotransferase [Rhodobacterales bacterium]
MARKIFGIGFHKTGTTSLGEALKILGYSVTGPNWINHGDIGHTHLARCRALSHDFDAFQDNPWPLVFREMDAMWPDAKFILTVRDPKKWIQSQTKHFSRDTTPMRKFIYGTDKGCPLGNEAHYIATYQFHNAAVRGYFKDHPGKLLELDFERPVDWSALCAFLDKPVPSIEFPHANPAGTDRSITLRTRIRHKIQNLFSI